MMGRSAYLYKNYKRMIAGRAWTFHYLTGIEFEELHAQGRLIFVQARKDFIAGKSSFSSWLWLYLTTRLANFVGTFHRNVSLDDDLIHLEPHSNLNPRRLLIWKETIGNLSTEAKEVVRLLMGSPAEALNIIGTEPPRIIRGAIRRHLQDEGWPCTAIWDAFREIKQVLRNL